MIEWMLMLRVSLNIPTRMWRFLVGSTYRAAIISTELKVDDALSKSSAFGWPVDELSQAFTG
jgi:hypothetical protein